MHLCSYFHFCLPFYSLKIIFVVVVIRTRYSQVYETFLKTPPCFVISLQWFFNPIPSLANLMGFPTASFALKFPLLCLTMNMYSLKTFYHHLKSLIRGENSPVVSLLQLEITIIIEDYFKSIWWQMMDGFEGNWSLTEKHEL